jgi:zinc D-Ala-D-Ala carboxypeptidase
MKPSKHLSWKELNCRDGTPYPEEFRNDGTLEELVKMFEAVRKELGDEPIIILSGYRTKKWNRKVGGSRGSQHTLGRALDIKHTKLSPLEVQSKLRLKAKELGIKGLGKYNTFTHIDCRKTTSSKLATWSGNKDASSIS